jgi:hypothetical protein
MLYLASPEVQKAQWARIGCTPSLHPALPPLPTNAKGWSKGRNGVGKGLNAGVSVVDVEHSLCEAEKYYRIRYPHINIKGGKTEVKPYKQKSTPRPVTRIVPRKFHWLDDHAVAQNPHQVARSNKLQHLPMLGGSESQDCFSVSVDSSLHDTCSELDAGREDDNVTILEGASDAEYDPEQEWEVSHIVSEMPYNPRLGNGQRKSTHVQAGVQYLVRYVGYGPRDDYWIPEQELDGAPELVEVWKTRKERIRLKIAEILTSK